MHGLLEEAHRPATASLATPPATATLRGALRSAGTFSNKKDADTAWQKAETRLAEGRLGDPRRGRQTFRRYVTEEWLPNHVIEVTTREAYTYQLNKHIMPWFGPMRMNEIMASTVREWVTDLQAKGVSPATIQKVRFILSAIFTTALNDVTYLHPCKGVKTPTVPRKPLKIITPEQFDAIYAAIPDAILQLLVETDIETGLRWGELTELRVRDLDPITRVLTISRTVVQVDPKFHPDGERFLVKEYPKDKEYRRLKLSAQLTAQDHRAHHGRQPRPGRPDLRDAAAGLPRRPAARRARPGRARLHQAERRRAPVPARDDERLQRREVPVHLLHGRRRDLPGPAPGRWQGLPAPAADRGHRRPHPARLVPAEGLEARARSGPGSRSPYARMTCATRMPHGCSPVAPTCRWSRTGSATAASPPRRSTCTPSPRPTTWRWTRSARSATAPGGQREPAHPRRRPCTRSPRSRSWPAPTRWRTATRACMTGRSTTG